MMPRTSFRWFNCFLIVCFIHRMNSECDWVKEDPYIPTRVHTPLGGFIGQVAQVHDIFYKSNYLVEEYLGVPYAKPPIGDLRFRRPHKIEAWNDNRSFHCLPNACPQLWTSPWPWSLVHKTMDEDCLYMNIWAPHYSHPSFHSNDKKSVLLFIPGGGIMNSSGSASDPIYNGRLLSGIGKIIVVVPNYRIGTLGYWSSTKDRVVSKMSKAPGNLALWDIIMVLRWLIDNIEYFGGDKNSITLAGQGFGSVIVSLLSISPRAKGLYKRQIMQSGSAMWQYNYNLTYNFDISQKIAEKVGCAKYSTDLSNDEDKVINCMKTKDAMTLIEAEAETSRFFPVWGDELLERNPRDSIMRSDFSFSELLISFSGVEGIPLLLDDYSEVFGFFGEKSIDPNNSLPWIQKIIDEKFDIPNFLEVYFPHFYGIHRNLSLITDWRIFLADAMGDYTVTCPTVYYAERSVISRAPVYFYWFAYKPETSVWSDWVPPTHFDEINLVFGHPGKVDDTFRRDLVKPRETPGSNWTVYTEALLSRELMAHWIKFVKYGKPQSNWPPCSFCDSSTVIEYNGRFEKYELYTYLVNHCNFWRHRYE